MDFTQLKENLQALGYRVHCFATAREAADYLDTAIDGKTVGMGGSVTLQQLGICERLQQHNQVHWHWKTPGAQAQAQTAQVYLSSVNALAQTGEIVNIDGQCNRVSAMLYGHETVYLVVGSNKLTKTCEEAVARARNVAAPKNAQRLQRNTPCAVHGDKCYNCTSPERICKALCLWWQKPSGIACEVLLIDSELGY